jgi:PQQ-dependent dehydrogenase (methanol/ethanol family)
MWNNLPAIGAIFLVATAAGADSNWPVHGGTPNGQGFSPLRLIDDRTVSRLGLAWSRELGTSRGLEATPIVENGVLYTTGSWSVVFALDARTGETKWTYDPKVRREWAYFYCCDVVNRGVALSNGKVYLGTLDGRLIALDQRTGAPIWSVQTTDPAQPYSITGAPCIAGDKVVIGNSGADQGVRGYITAYDAETGKSAWRFYTVPGDPAKGFESKAMEAAARTWHGKEWWKSGGGGSPWEGMVYDSRLDLLFFGTGNAFAWYRALRGEGDSLYTACILAVKASTGELAWYFQTTPGDSFDFDATQPLILADLTMQGRPRAVVLQANKNGFFYVLDRRTGAFLSATPFVRGITWATGVDPKTGRPIEVPGAGDTSAKMVSPDMLGAHNWDPMAFHPGTGLVYLSARIGTQMVHVPDDGRTERSDAGLLYAKMASMPPPHGELLAWDPVARKAVWRAGYPVVNGGGVLATGGRLVFHGRSDGVFAAYRATDGELLWRFDTGTGIMAAPVTYTVEGVQYVTVMAGWGGPVGLQNAQWAGAVKPGWGRILTFALDGKSVLKAPPFGHRDPPVPAITAKQNLQAVHDGTLLFITHCIKCHGIDAVAGPLADLRYSTKETLDSFTAIVLDGARTSDGMPSFKKILSAKDVDAIRAYVIARAQETAKPAKTALNTPH